MKKFFFFLLSLCSLHSFDSCSAENPAKGKLTWLTNYEEAVNQSKASSKPMVLFFTGSDWCGWCNRLEEEVLDSQPFYDLAGNSFIFLKLDFPLYAAQSPQVNAQNKELQRKYDVRSYPTLIILDSQQQKIGQTGYKPGGGKAYAMHLQKMVSDYLHYKQNMQNIDKQKLSGLELKKLYEKSKELDLNNDESRIVKAGMDSDHALFFALEQYRIYADEGLLGDYEAKQLKKRLMAMDPNNKKQTHYHLAVIEFEARCEEMEKKNYSAELAVEPLTDYIKNFGNQDKEHVWRLQMIISQVFLDKNRLDDALAYAKFSLKAAPPSVRPEIATAVQSIQAKLSEATTR